MKKLSAALFIAALFLTACGKAPVPAGTETETEIKASVAETSAAETTKKETTAPGTASSETSASAAPETTIETTVEPEPPEYEFVSEEAEKIYGIIKNRFADMDYFGRTTLIDLDDDGVPEFLKLTGDNYSPVLTVYGIEGETVTEIITLDDLFAGDDNIASRYPSAFIPYTDENGSKSWVIPYMKHSTEDWRDPERYREYFLSAFDFKGDEVSETILFNNKITSNDIGNEQILSEENAAKYYGYPYLYSEFYAFGEKVKAPEDKQKEFWDGLDELIRKYENDYKDEDPGANYWGALPWSCEQYYPNADQTEWELQKMAFLNGLIEKESAYKLSPGINSLAELINTYYSGDKNNFLTDTYFYVEGKDVCKPVIYLYPEEPADVDVSVIFPQGGSFTCTYPDYENGWSVTAYPDGTVINKADGLEYSYLYWEGEGFKNLDFSAGFVIKGGDTTEFLREKLSYLGLKPREYNEFIVYWLPLMQNNEYNLITFQTDRYEENAELIVSPEPDSMLRVFMAYAPLESYIEIPEQRLEPFEREGFAVIEWGGTCVE